jgi:hypothetical protein
MPFAVILYRVNRHYFDPSAPPDPEEEDDQDASADVAPRDLDASDQSSDSSPK